MPRYARDSALTVTLETVYGTYVAPNNSTDGVLCTLPDVTALDVAMRERDFNRTFLGNAEMLTDTPYKRVAFQVDAVGSGAGTLPGFNEILRSCGCDTVREVGVRVDYTPSVALAASLSINYFDAGLASRGRGARGSWGINFRRGEIPKFSFDMRALQQLDEEVSTPAAVPVGYNVPQLVQDGVTFLRQGSSVNTSGAVAITGGTATPCASWAFQSGVELTSPETFGDRAVEITNRKPTLELELDYTAAQELAALGSLTGGSVNSWTLQHGTVAGRRVLMHIPQGQITAIGKVTGEGARRRQRISIAPRFAANAGNDDWRLVLY